MQWRILFAFLIGCVLGAVALFLYLQGSGRLTPVVIANNPSARVSAGPGASPAATPSLPARSDPVPVEPKPLAEPEAVAVRIDDSRPMAIPVAGVEKGQLRDLFAERRGARRHEAIDILSPRGTPVLAAVDGKIARLFTSVPGGITIYQLDSEGKLIYYYAHLERYAPDIVQGKNVLRGEVIGYVGTSGNAPKDTPHLHFAIMQPKSPKEWWTGAPINPYPLLMDRGVTYNIPQAR
jgi:murein DD-endopeptidase MepM/ murein hydrolase activator NlpD